MTERHQLGELQLAIMRVLWQGGPQTVVQVHTVLTRDRSLASSTIGTMLQKMERKGVVRHARDGRRYLYRATVQEAEVQRDMVGTLKVRLFGGDALALIGHLVREEELDGVDLERLKEMIAERDRKRDGERPA